MTAWLFFLTFFAAFGIAPAWDWLTSSPADTAPTVTTGGNRGEA